MLRAFAPFRQSQSVSESLLPGHGASVAVILVARLAVAVVVMAMAMVVIVATDLLTGILVGLGASALQVLYRLTHFDVWVRQSEDGLHVHLTGAGTFLRLPRLLALLESFDGIYFLCNEAGTLHACPTPVVFLDEFSFELVDIDVGDFDGDDDLDVAAVDFDSGQLYVVHGNGDGTFDEIVEPIAIATVDTVEPRALRVGSIAGEASDADLQTLRRFVLQDKHREVLAEAWPRALRRRPAGGVLRDLLVDLLKVRG